MMIRIRSILLDIVLAAALSLLLVPEARAQSDSVVTLTPAEWARWDVAFAIGRQGVDRSDIGPEWDAWYQSASYAAGVGRFLTPNIKLDLEIARSARADLFTSETVTGPDTPAPYFRTQQHHFTTMVGAAGAVYQAFENRWFHPYAGGGIEILRESRHSDPSQQSPGFRNGIAIPLPASAALPASEAVSITARPFANAGFKVFVSPQAFLKTGMRVSLSRDGGESAVWHAGLGFEF